MASAKKNATFEEHFNNLESLSRELQDNKVSIDQLIPKMKGALTSIKVCKEVLTETKSQLKEISSEFEDLEKIAESED